MAIERQEIDAPDRAGNSGASTQEPVANRALTERPAVTDDVAVEIQVSREGMEPKSVRRDGAW